MHIGFLWDEFATNYFRWKGKEIELKESLKKLDENILEALKKASLKEKHKEMLISSCISFHNALNELRGINSEIDEKRFEIGRLRVLLQDRIYHGVNLYKQLKKLNLNSKEELLAKIKSLPCLKTLKQKSKELTERMHTLYEEVKVLPKDSLEFNEKLKKLKSLKEELDLLNQKYLEREGLEKLYTSLEEMGYSEEDLKSLWKEAQELEGKIGALESEIRDLTLKKYTFEKVLTDCRNKISFYRKLYIESIRAFKEFFSKRELRKRYLREYFKVKHRSKYTERIYESLFNLTRLLNLWLFNKEVFTIRKEDGLLLFKGELLQKFTGIEKLKVDFLLLMLKLFLEGELNYCYLWDASDISLQ